jgi:ribosome-associated toxin RatA of RatAB toxin-antitoxin module
MSLDLRFEFSHHNLEASFSYMFEKAMDSMVHAFKGRALELYGEGATLDMRQKRF